MFFNHLRLDVVSQTEEVRCEERLVQISRLKRSAKDIDGIHCVIDGSAPFGSIDSRAFAHNRSRQKLAELRVSIIVVVRRDTGLYELRQRDLAGHGTSGAAIIHHSTNKKLLRGDHDRV